LRRSACRLTRQSWARFFCAWGWGAKIVLFFGITLTGVGLAFAVVVQPFILVLSGIGLAGLAVGNVVPILLTAAGRQRVMPAANAIAATSTLGYLGILMGPR